MKHVQLRLLLPHSLLHSTLLVTNIRFSQGTARGTESDEQGVIDESTTAEPAKAELTVTAAETPANVTAGLTATGRAGTSQTDAAGVGDQSTAQTPSEAAKDARDEIDSEEKKAAEGYTRD